MSDPTFHYLVRAIVEREGSFLLTRERGSAFAYLPGGHVELGEPAEGALQRELHEELGVHGRVEAFVGALEYGWTDEHGRPHQEINLLFRADLGPVDGAEVTSREPHLEVFWCEPGAFGRVDLRPEPARALLAGRSWEGSAWWSSTLRGHPR